MLRGFLFGLFWGLVASATALAFSSEILEAARSVMPDRDATTGVSPAGADVRPARAPETVYVEGGLATPAADPPPEIPTPSAEPASPEGPLAAPENDPAPRTLPGSAQP